ncbi:hypothetical protein CMI37_27130 [Candidatus Pacearchaeota archaeon]|nr:hypothetical protein [Candidatus Pacearchaeota archaeon]
MRRQLRRYNRKRGIHHPLLALDFENDPKTGDFICAGLFGDVRYRTSYRDGGRVQVRWTTRRVDAYFTNLSEVFNFLMSLDRNSCILIFYNLSYDRWFLDTIADHHTVLAVGQRVISLKLKNGLRCMDLLNHPCEGSLEDWIGYLNLGTHFGVVKGALTDYRSRVCNDAQATYHLGTFLEDFYYYECGIPLQLTVGSAALKLFTMRFFTDYWTRDDEDMSLYERDAYYGGRAELFQRGTLPTWGYDVNSMYLSIMQDCQFPDMLTGKFINHPSKNWRRYLDDYMGIWRVRVETPADLDPLLLPVRMGGKLKFPRGTLSGCWTSVELLEAERHGYKIVEVYSFIYYARCKFYFRDYARFIWAKRLEYKTQNNIPMDKMIKRLGNALYGKFAQRNHQEYFGRLSDYPEELPPRVKLFEYHGEMWVQVEGEPQPASYEFPAVSAFVTAYARIKLYRAMLANRDALIYVDTDSLKLTRPAVGIPVGDGLGEWSLDIEGDPILYHRPKLYGDTHKGVPKRAGACCLLSLKRAYINAELETWNYAKPLRYREAVKSGDTPNVWVDIYKHLIYADDKREWKGDRSKPLEYNLQTTFDK